MMKLLRVNFARLRMNGIFKICMIAVAVTGLIPPLMGRQLMSVRIIGTDSYQLDYFFFQYIIFIVMVEGVFCGIYIGTEYSNGTIRNKIVAGYTRTGIYFSNLITNAAAGCILFTAYILVNFCTGRLLIGRFSHFSQWEILLFLVCCYMLMISFAFLFTMFTMLIKNMTAGISGCIGIVLIFMIYGVYHLDHLTDAVWLTVVGEGKKNLTLFFADFFPGSQLMEFFYITDDVTKMDPVVMIWGSVSFAVIAGLAGWIGMRRKELI